jgi:hypothetical protein
MMRSCLNASNGGSIFGPVWEPRNEESTEPCPHPIFLSEPEPRRQLVGLTPSSNEAHLLGDYCDHNQSSRSSASVKQDLAILEPRPPQGSMFARHFETINFFRRRQRCRLCPQADHLLFQFQGSGVSRRAPWSSPTAASCASTSSTR